MGGDWLLTRTLLHVCIVCFWSCSRIGLLKTEHLVLSEELIDDIVLARDIFELAGEAEVANFDSAVLQNQQISRFDVAMHHPCRVDVLQPTQQVVDNCLNVAFRQIELASVYFPQIRW